MLLINDVVVNTLFLTFFSRIPLKMGKIKASYRPSTDESLPGTMAWAGLFLGFAIQKS